MTAIPTAHGDVHLTAAELRELAKNNPGVDVPAELKRLRAWLLEPGRSLPAVSAVRGVVGAWMARARRGPRPSIARALASRPPPGYGPERPKHEPFEADDGP